MTTTTDMHGDSPASRNLQVWRLSDLALLHTIALPDGPAGNEGLLTAEPRLMADGKTVLVSTFSCGLYLMEGLDGDAPSGRLVASFPQKEGTVLRDSGDRRRLLPGHRSRLERGREPGHQRPAAPREVSRVTLGRG